MGKVLTTQPLWARLASQPAEALVSLGRWGLVGRQLPGVVRRQAGLRRTTVELAHRARVALAAAGVRQRLAAALVAQATAAPIWAEQAAVAAAAEPAAEQAKPERAVAVLVEWLAQAVAVADRVAVPAARVAEVAAQRP